MREDEMRSYIIFGRVLDRKTQTGLEGLRVEAWDKDMILDDLVGAAVTGERGGFQIRFEESDFKDIFMDRQPDLYFKVFRGDDLIESTEDSVLWNVEREDIEVVLEVDEPADDEQDQDPAIGPGLQPAARSLLQATYTPRQPRPGEDPAMAPRALEKGVFIARLAPSPEELAELADRYREESNQANASKLIAAQALSEVKTLSGAMGSSGRIDLLRNGKQLAGLRVDVLTQVAYDLVELRQKTLSTEPDTRAIGRQIQRLRNLVDAFREEMAVERVGYLHLERMSFAPAGIERGELVYSVPLSPGEEVNIRHREWSRTSEEFERIVTDYLEEFSEEGVTEKSELAESVNSQAQHSTAFNTGVTASGSYGSVSITATVGYNASDSSSKSEQLSRNQSTDITHKASSRAKKEHKISFRVASVTETEDETVQRIRNPFPDRATRVDYYQLLRKWQVNLYRYGIRLTYDIMVPEPGSGLLSKLAEIDEVRRQLEVGFDSMFPLRPEDLDRDTYEQTAADYSAGFVDRPQPDPKRFSDCRVFEWERDDWGNDQWRNLTFEVEIPEDYQVDGAEYVEEGTIGWGDYCAVTPFTDLDDWKDKSGRFTALIRMKDIQTVYAGINVDAKLCPEAVRAWQHKVWSQIRDAAQKQYYEDRQKLKDRLDRLEEELGAQDALSLRKKEREEVMQGTLAALGLPPEDFRQNPRIIRFIHHAIEWENMLYFLYPYFWSDPDKQIGSDLDRQIESGSEKEEQKDSYLGFKKYLDHPDPMHRAFLKAGCTRVVLTIRPGYEDAFMAFVNALDPDQLPPAPYLEIGKEFEAYAKTNYPGIPPANPVDSFRPLLTPMQKKTWERMRLLIRLLEVFHKSHRRYPLTTEQKGESLETLRQAFPMKDPWGSNYVYTCPGQYGEYDLVSYGADGSPGGENEGADIVNWHPAFLKDLPEQVQAWEDIQLIEHLLDEYYKLHEAYPSTQEGLEALEQLIPLKDAWGNDYVYSCPGVHGEYDLASHGKDGKPGGEGKDADITSWAEASLVGQWYEYTPTSALDIAFDEEVPAA